MITLPEMAAEALGAFLASDVKDRFGSSHARLAEIIPFAAKEMQMTRRQLVLEQVRLRSSLDLRSDAACRVQGRRRGAQRPRALVRRGDPSGSGQSIEGSIEVSARSCALRRALWILGRR